MNVNHADVIVGNTGKDADDTPSVSWRLLADSTVCLPAVSKTNKYYTII